MEILYYEIYDFPKNEKFFIRYKNGVVHFFDQIFSLVFFFFFFFSFFDVAYNKILKGYGDFKPAVIVHKNWGGGLPNRF